MKNEAPIVSGKGKDVNREKIVKSYQVNLDARLSQPKMKKQKFMTLLQQKECGSNLSISFDNYFNNRIPKKEAN